MFTLFSYLHQQVDDNLPLRKISLTCIETLLEDRSLNSNVRVCLYSIVFMQYKMCCGWQGCALFTCIIVNTTY